jgi:hypothetical protein
VQGDDRQISLVAAFLGHARRHRGATESPSIGPGGGNSEIINPRCAERKFQVIDSIPFSRLFTRAAAIVHHGGIGASSQALFAAIPQLIMDGI